MAFNEDSRVKIPALLHLVRLGYTYIPRKEQDRIEESNIFPELFKESISDINPGVDLEELSRLLDELTLKLDYDDLGREFCPTRAGSAPSLFQSALISNAEPNAWLLKVLLLPLTNRGTNDPP